jgi:hypothetical protein
LTIRTLRGRWLLVLAIRRDLWLARIGVIGSGWLLTIGWWCMAAVIRIRRRRASTWRPIRYWERVRICGIKFLRLGI